MAYLISETGQGTVYQITPRTGIFAFCFTTSDYSASLGVRRLETYIPQVLDWPFVRPGFGTENGSLICLGFG